MSEIDVFVKNLKYAPLHQLEDMSGKWLEIEHINKDKILPYIIQEKLVRYEEEY